jgi:hypothetical protein
MKDGNRTNTSHSIGSDVSNDCGNLIISLKFFKFVTDDDVNKEQRVFIVYIGSWDSKDYFIYRYGRVRKEVYRYTTE